MAPNPNMSIRGKWKFRSQSWKHSPLLRALQFLFLAVLLYVALADHMLTETYDIEPNTYSKVTIYAKERILNEAATERAREKAATEVEPVYTFVSTDYNQLIERVFNKLESINPDPNYTNAEKAEIYRIFFQNEFETHVQGLLSKYEREGFAEQLLGEMKKQLESQRYRIPEEAYFLLPRLSPEDIQEMEPVVKSVVGRLMAEPSANAQPLRDKVAELVNASSLGKNNVREMVKEIARYTIMPNRFYDELRFQEAIEEARNAVQPIYIEPEQPIVKENQLITPEIYHILESQGMLKEKANYGPQTGLAFLVALIVFLIYLFIRRSDLPLRQNNALLLMFVLIFTLNLLVLQLISYGRHLEFPYIGFLAPVAMGSMLIAILLDDRLAFLASVVFAIASSVLFSGEQNPLLFDFRYGFVALVVCFVSIFAVRKASQRSGVLRAGITVSLFSALSIVAMLLLGNETGVREVLYALSFAAASGIVTAILVIGLLPFFEVAFGILSPLRLVELSNPNHPLLRKLLTETPGTYHHSVMVGNLAEAAAEAIGANGLLCRVGSFYHDIGKTKRPSYFIENQGSMENPHDSIDPMLSAAIIVAHAKDGAEMLREHKMPRQICDIAEQHHGTTLLKYFYHKQLKLKEAHPDGDAEVREEDFRYPGPKAQTKEAAIVGIADCVEAAVRSLRNPTIEQIDSMVDKIIKDRLEDNQFNECDLTMKELDKVGKALKETLLGIFHSRIEYPELPNKQRPGQPASANDAAERGERLAEGT